jgi:hypothetical protein
MHGPVSDADHEQHVISLRGVPSSKLMKSLAASTFQRPFSKVDRRMRLPRPGADLFHSH